MTDTTDIQALSDRLRSLAKTATPGKWWIDSHGEALVAFTDEGIETVLKPEHLRDKAHRDENTGSLSYWPNDSDASWIAAAQPQNIIALLDQLEAERQRADAVCRDIRIQANDLKSAQTVNKVLQATLAELKGGQVPVGEVVAWNHPNEERKVDFRFLRFDVQPGTQLFTAPQKPVAPVGFLFVVKATGAVIYSIADAAIEGTQLIGQIYGDAAIEAAGGIVKDGE